MPANEVITDSESERVASPQSILAPAPAIRTAKPSSWDWVEAAMPWAIWQDLVHQYGFASSCFTMDTCSNAVLEAGELDLMRRSNNQFHREGRPFQAAFASLPFGLFVNYGL
jgi:hypothetical protein